MASAAKSKRINIIKTTRTKTTTTTTMTTTAISFQLAKLVALQWDYVFILNELEMMRHLLENVN